MPAPEAGIAIASGTTHGDLATQSLSHRPSGREAKRHSAEKQFSASYDATTGRCKVMVSYGSINSHKEDVDTQGLTDSEPLLLFPDPKNNPVAEDLQLCTKSVLKYYNKFLQIVGWRKFRCPKEDLHEHCCSKMLNAMYLIFIIVLIFVVGTVQFLMCVRRDTVVTTENNNSSCSNNATFCSECLKHSITAFPIPDVVLFVAYIYALCIFRFSKPDYLEKLTQEVFLGQAFMEIETKRKKQLTCSLRLQLLLGVLWLIFSLISSTCRIIVRETAQTRVQPIWSPHSDGWRYASEAVLGLGFVIFDLVYLSVVVNYSFQCQLLIYHVQSIKDRVLHYTWQGIDPKQSTLPPSIDPILEKAMKEMDNLKIYVLHLNHRTSWAVSLLMFLFVKGGINAFIALLNLSNMQPLQGAQILIAVLNLFQWASILVLPIVQAARLNASCNSLKSLGHEVRSRPNHYTEMSFLHLDSFLSYTATLQLSVEFVYVRMTPGIVGGGCFIIASVLIYLLQYNLIFHWVAYL